MHTHTHTHTQTHTQTHTHIYIYIYIYIYICMYLCMYVWTNMKKHNFCRGWFDLQFEVFVNVKRSGFLCFKALSGRLNKWRCIVWILLKLNFIFAEKSKHWLKIKTINKIIQWRLRVFFFFHISYFHNIRCIHSFSYTFAQLNGVVEFTDCISAEG